MNIQATNGRPYIHFSWLQLLNAKSAAPPYGIYISARPSKAKAFVGTHAGTETIHRIVSVPAQIALFEPRNYTTIKKDTV